MARGVLHLIDTGGPGGAETVFATLAERLDGPEWRSIPVVPEPGWLKSRLEDRGMEPVLLPGGGSFDVRYLARLVRLVRRTGADLVHAHLLGSAVYGSLAARAVGLPIVATFHGTVDLESPGPLAAVKFGILNRPRSRVVFVSESLRDEVLSSTRLRAGRTSVIHNGIDPGAYSTRRTGRLRRELGVGPDELLVGSVGNVRPAKDYGLLLRAAATLRDRGVEGRYVMVGDTSTPLHDELLRLRERLGLERSVAFTGFRGDVASLLPDLDVFLLTSSSEGFSISTLEALASGVPVVATRCGGPEEIISDGVHGVLVEPGSAEALADGVERMVKSPEEGRRMAERGRRRVASEFSQARMLDRYASLYASLAA